MWLPTVQLVERNLGRLARRTKVDQTKGNKGWSYALWFGNSFSGPGGTHRHAQPQAYGAKALSQNVEQQAYEGERLTPPVASPHLENLRSMAFCAMMCSADAHGCGTISRHPVLLRAQAGEQSLWWLPSARKLRVP